MKEVEVSRKALSGLKWTAIMRVLGQVINWGISIVVIRYIKPEEYGLKSMAEIAIGVLMMMSAGGMESSIIQAKELTKDKISKIFGWLIIINLLLFVIQTIGAYWLADYYNDSRVVLLTQVMAASFLFVPFNSIPYALLSRDMDYKVLSSISLITNIVGAACTLVMALTGFGVWSLISGPILTSFLSAVALNIYRPCLILPRFSISGMTDMMIFGGVLVLTSLLWSVFSRADVFIAGRLLNSHEVGIYAVALYLASLPVDKVIPILNQVAFPAYARLRDNPELVAKYFLMSMKLTAVIIFPISFGIAGISQQVIPIVLGEKWREVSDILFMLCLVFPLRGVSSLCAPMTNAMGKPTTQLNLVVIASILMVPGFLFGAHFGVKGLTLVWVVIYPWIVLINLWLSKGIIKLSFFSILRAIVPSMAMAGIMLYSLRYVFEMVSLLSNGYAGSEYVNVGVMILVGATIYIAGIMIVDRSTLIELRKLIKS